MRTTMLAVALFTAVVGGTLAMHPQPADADDLPFALRCIEQGTDNGYTDGIFVRAQFYLCADDIRPSTMPPASHGDIGICDRWPIWSPEWGVYVTVLTCTTYWGPDAASRAYGRDVCVVAEAYIGNSSNNTPGSVLVGCVDAPTIGRIAAP